MISFIIKKLELLILTLFILTIILFWVHVRITGTETDSIIPEYWNYAVRLITLNFGNSSVSGMPIVDEIKIFFPPTIELLLLSLISAFVVGVPLGIFGGLNHHSGSDKCIYTFCLLSTSIPVYWSSQILILRIYQSSAYHRKYLSALRCSQDDRFSDRGRTAYRRQEYHN